MAMEPQRASSMSKMDEITYLSLVLLLISNLTNELCLHQFLVPKTIQANKSLKTDANGAH